MQFPCCILPFLALLAILIPSPASTVKIPPSIVQQTMNLTYPFNIGESFKLVCEAEGDPMPTFLWKFNDGDFDWSSKSGRYTKYPGQGTLVFISPQKDDDGIYQCLAKNDLGTSLGYKIVVRRAEFGNSQGESSPGTKEARLGGNVKFECAIPNSYPDPIVRWVRESPNAGKIYLAESNRLSFDPVNGELLMANIQEEDNDWEFYCSILNPVVRQSVTGRKFKLKVRGSTPIYQRSKYMGRMPGITVVLEGETKSLYCMFSGNPTPMISWRKDGVLIDASSSGSTVRLLNSGTKLELIDIKKSVHAGRYQCDGINEKNGGVPDTITFTVQVLSKPYWKPNGKLKSTTVADRGSHTFVCDAGGDPIPTITWYVNGIRAELAQKPTRRIVGNKFVFSNVSVDGDPCVVQCNASNPHGYAFADAYLNVLREPPVFTIPPANLVKAVGSEVYVTCQTFSAPPAVVTWKKNDDFITGGRYELQENGDLYIESLSITDAGRFECTAKNTYGVRSASATLIVRQPTKIKVPPQNTKIYEQQEVKLLCTAVTDIKEQNNLKIVWYKDGTIIDFDNNPRLTTNHQDYSLIISGTQPLDTGVYACNATNGIDYDNQEAQLTILGRPEMPTRVEADCNTYKGQKIAMVSWNPGSDNYAPILRYLVEFSTQYSEDTWYAADVISDNSTSSKTDTSIRVQMRPNIRYRFRVKGINIVGESEPSGNTNNINECYLNPQQPTRNPTNLWAEGNLPNNLVVYWTPLSVLDFNGPNLQYKLRIRCLKCSNVADTSYNETTIDNPFQEKVEFLTLRFGSSVAIIETYKPYEVEIYAKNAQGDSVATVRPKSVGYSGENPPAVAPEGLKQSSSPDAILSDSVKLSWNMATNPNTEEKINGYFRGFRMEWCLKSYTNEQCNIHKRFKDYIVNPITGPSSVGQFNTRSKRQSSFDFTAELTHLPGNSEINIWVRVLNKFHAGPPSNVLTVKTKEGTPGQVGEFVLENTGVNHLEFKWLAPPQTNGELTGYQLAYQEIRGLTTGFLTYGPLVESPTQTKGIVSGLKPNTNYRVFMYARTSVGNGEPTFLDVRTAPPDQAPNAPTFTVNTLGEKGFNVSFAPSKVGIAGSVFYVQYRIPGRSKWFETQREYRQRWISINDLMDDEWYDVRVVATNGAGRTTYADSVRVRTGGKPSPNALQGASATWFICMFVILIVLIIFMALLCFLRKKRLNEFRGKQVPTYYETPEQQTGGNDLPPAGMDPYNETMRPPSSGVYDRPGMMPPVDRAPSYASDEKAPLPDTPPRHSNVSEEAYTPVTKPKDSLNKPPTVPQRPPKPAIPAKPSKPIITEPTDDSDEDNLPPASAYGRAPPGYPSRPPPAGGVPMAGYQPAPATSLPPQQPPPQQPPSGRGRTIGAPTVI